MIVQELGWGGCNKYVQFTLELNPDMQPDAFLLEHFQKQVCYEAENAWVMFHVLDPGDRAIDVGANIGFFTLMMSRLVGDTGHVVACEPGFNNLPTLRHHLELNKASNVSIVEKPIWCREEKVTFYINSDTRSSNALYDPGNWADNFRSRANPMPLQLDATTIDAIAEGPIKLIKIDTEGAEQRVLEGASKLLEQQHPPYVLAELNPHGLAQAGCDSETLRSFMRGYGYSLFFIHPHDLLPSLVPDKTKVIYREKFIVANGLFSTLDHVAARWPEMMG